MNRYFRILLGAGLAASLAACSQKAEFTTDSFVAFDATSFRVNEDAGTLEIPVYAYTKDGNLAFPRGESANTTVTFEVIDGSARNGTDFSVEPANGVLTFDGSSAGSIKVNIVNHDGDITGNLDFSIRITGASDGYTLGGAREASVEINDLDYVFSVTSIEDLLGTYTATALSMGTAVEWTFEMTRVGESNTVCIDVMVPFLEDYAGYVDINGEVSDDLRTISFHVPSETNLLYEEGDPFVYCEYIGDMTLSTQENDIVFNIGATGELTSEQGICAVPLGAMAAYNGALLDPGTIVFTKQ